MKIPGDMTQQEVMETITKVTNKIAPGYTFYGYTVDDIKQESFMICVEALDRFEKGRNLENFLSVHLSNRLKNFVRDNHFTTANDISRINVMQPAQLDNDNHVVDNYKPSNYNDLNTSDMIVIINRELSATCRMDYLKMLNGVYVPKPRREEIEEIIINILQDYGYETGQDI